MNRDLVRVFACVVGLGSAFLGAPSLQAQQTATVTGVVVDGSTGAPLGGVRVLVDGINIRATTDDQGRYTLRNVPFGPAIIRAIMIGYSSVSARYTLSTAQSTADFTLQPAVISLDEIVVTATGETRKRAVVNAIATIDASDVVAEKMPQTVTSLIQGRAAGVQIINSSGTAGTATKIRIRGSSSVSLSNEPLLVVDGIRVESRANSVGFGNGGQSISRINDFNPDDIESIEIVKGPSAAALYGTAAANGVVVITTKRGVAGRTVWNAYVEQGLAQDFLDYPTNYRGIDATGSTCRLAENAAGTCTQTDLQTANPLEGPRAPFRTGHRQQFGANVSGGSDAVQYYVSGEWEIDNGIYGIPQVTRDSIAAAGSVLPKWAENPNRVERATVRANINARLNDKTDLNIATGFVTGDIWLPQNDNNSLGMLPSGLLGTADTSVNGGYGFHLPEEIFLIEGRQGVDRFTGSGNLQWRPTNWLSGRSTVGLDFTQRSDIQFQPTGTGPDTGIRRQGVRTSDKTNIYTVTLDVGGSAQFDLSDRLSSTTSIGFQYNRSNFEQIETTGNILAPGSASQKAATDQFIDEDFIESITAGGFVDQSFGLDDRLFVTAAIRGDDNSTFGRNLGLTFYPKFGTSYVVFEGGTGALNNFRVRGAWGSSGQQPLPNTAELFFNPVSITDDNTSVVGVSIGGPGNQELKPERSTEVETGFDAAFFDGRLGLEATFYQRTTTDALIARRLAPSIGLTQTRVENIGKTRNRGIEGVLSATVLDGPNLAWDLTISGSTNANELLDLGGVDPIVQGNIRFVEGFPLGGFWQEPITWNDDNADGVITPSELVVADSAEFLGYGRPRYEISLSNTIEILSNLRISGLWDYRGGHKQDNLTENFRCRFNVCRGLSDPSAPLLEQARAQSTDAARVSNALWIQDAWFIKLREVSLSWQLPQSVARSLRTNRMLITLTGRNLLTITDYPGLDPEVQGQTADFAGRDFLTQPQVRSVNARLQFTF